MQRRAFLKNIGAGFGAALMNSTAFGQIVSINEKKLAHRNQNRSSVVCREGVVCASQPMAAIAGLDVLQAGGNAVDAAICANSLLSVVEPNNCGPGGDLFAIVWIEKEKKLYGLNASGRSPFNWNLAEAKKLGLKKIPLYGPLSWSVPGCVSGWNALWKRFGKVQWSRLFEPAVEYARDGFVVSPIVARDWYNINPKQWPNLAATFCPSGRKPQFGSIFKNPDIANFFELLADGGAEEFYRGRIAERIVEYSRRVGGRFTMRDFTSHHCQWVDPVCTNYRGYDVYELPPNGQGIAAIQMLNLLEHFDIGQMPPNSAEQLHLFVEAKKLAFEDRARYYADMDFADVPLDKLISKEYAAERVKLINARKANPQVYPGNPAGDGETIYLTTADKEGNMVSLIQSTYYGWGSQMVPDGLGFALQNRGTLFSLDPNHMNKLEAHKRPFHTIIPAFVTRGSEPKFSFGVMGGDFQPQGHCQILMNIIDFGMSVQQAGEQPRIEHRGSSTPTGNQMTDAGTVAFERGISNSVKLKLACMGHKLTASGGAFGGYQGIWREDRPLRYFGASDPRKDGCAVGF